MQFLTNLKVADYCKTPTNEKLKYFPTKKIGHIVICVIEI